MTTTTPKEAKLVLADTIRPDGSTGFSIGFEPTATRSEDGRDFQIAACDVVLFAVVRLLQAPQGTLNDHINVVNNAVSEIIESCNEIEADRLQASEDVRAGFEERFAALDLRQEEFDAEPMPDPESEGPYAAYLEGGKSLEEERSNLAAEFEAAMEPFNTPAFAAFKAAIHAFNETLGFQAYAEAD